MKNITKNKIIKHIIITLMLVYAGIFNCIGAFAEEKAELKVFSPECVNIGSSFEVKLFSSCTTKIKAISMSIVYDDYLSFKDVKELQNCEISAFKNSNNVNMIILFDDCMGAGDLCSCSFTAKSGMDTGNHNITFNIAEAVDSDLNDISVAISESITVKTTKKSDALSNLANSSSIKSSVSNKTSSSGNRSKNSSASSNTSSKYKNSIQSGTVSRLTKSKKDTENRLNGESLTQSDYLLSSDEVNEAVGNIDAVSNLFYSQGEFDSLSLQNDKEKYFFAGIGITLAVVGMLFAAFRMGQLSRRHNDIDKVFKDDEKNR